MSLIIAKVDKEKKLQSIYSDGFVLTGQNVRNTHQNKIIHFVSDGVNVCFGMCGPTYIGQWFRNHLKDTFVSVLGKTFPLNKEEKINFFEKKLPEVFDIMLVDYTKDRNIDASSEELKRTIEGLVVIDDMIFTITKYDEEKFQCLRSDQDDFCAVGQDEVAAKCMLHNNLSIQKIYDTISRYNTAVNGNVSSCENYIYF